jgi:hypothetical protein
MKPVAGVVFLLALCHPLANAQSEDTHGLLLRGKVLKVQTDRSYKGYVDLKLDLSLDFSNEGSAPAIIMRPWHEQDYWHGGSLIATTLQNAQTHKYLFADGIWESISSDDSYLRLARALDQPRPPEQLTMILKPGSSWNWRTSVTIRFEENTHWRYPRLPTWEEMKTQPSPLWLRVSFEMWPFNAEYFKPNLAPKLQKRWREFGYLWIGEKNGRMHLARLVSEPIELDWNAALSH